MRHRRHAVIGDDRDDRVGIVRERLRLQLADQRVLGLQRGIGLRAERPLGVAAMIECDEVHCHELRLVTAQHFQREARAQAAAGHVAVLVERPELRLEIGQQIVWPRHRLLELQGLV